MTDDGDGYDSEVEDAAANGRARMLAYQRSRWGRLVRGCGRWIHRWISQAIEAGHGEAVTGHERSVARSRAEAMRHNGIDWMPERGAQQLDLDEVQRLPFAETHVTALRDDAMPFQDEPSRRPGGGRFDGLLPPVASSWRAARSPRRPHR